MGQMPVKSNEPSSRYQIAPDGQIFRVEDDGSVTNLGNVEDRKNSPSNNNGTPPKKKNNLWKWILVFIAICITGIVAILLFLLSASHDINTPHNLDIAVRRGNQNLYIDKDNWNKEFKDGDQLLGIVIDRNGQQFILAYRDLNLGGHSINWDDAVYRFGSYLPTIEQANVIASQWWRINKALESCRADKMQGSYWTKTQYDNERGWFMAVDEMNNFSKNELNKLRIVVPLDGDLVRLQDSLETTIPHNLDLAVRRDNRTLYFNQNNWQNFYQTGDRKLGVVIDKDGQHFILALEDLNGGNALNWDNAMSRFGSQLPSREQARAMIYQWRAVNSALCAYGGSPMNQESGNHYPGYWTKYEVNSSEAYYFSMYDGVTRNAYKGNTGRIRSVHHII